MISSAQSPSTLLFKSVSSTARERLICADLFSLALPDVRLVVTSIYIELMQRQSSDILKNAEIMQILNLGSSSSNEHMPARDALKEIHDLSPFGTEHALVLHDVFRAEANFP